MDKNDPALPIDSPFTKEDGLPTPVDHVHAPKIQTIPTPDIVLPNNNQIPPPPSEKPPKVSLPPAISGPTSTSPDAFAWDQSQQEEIRQLVGDDGVELSQIHSLWADSHNELQQLREESYNLPQSEPCDEAWTESGSVQEDLETRILEAEERESELQFACDLASEFDENHGDLMIGDLGHSRSKHTPKPKQQSSKTRETSRGAIQREIKKMLQSQAADPFAPQSAATVADISMGDKGLPNSPLSSNSQTSELHGIPSVPGFPSAPDPFDISYANGYTPFPTTE